MDLIELIICSYSVGKRHIPTRVQAWAVSNGPPITPPRRQSAGRLPRIDRAPLSVPDAGGTPVRAREANRAEREGLTAEFRSPVSRLTSLPQPAAQDRAVTSYKNRAPYSRSSTATRSSWPWISGT